MSLNAQPLWDWMTRRHEIYLKRQAGAPPPWTDDPILRNNRFCNVFRELDTVTVWIRENWRAPFAENENLWIAMCLARQINLPASLAEIGFPEHGYDPRAVREGLERRRARGETMYTGAYMISAPAGPFSHMAKPQYTAEVVVGEVWNARHEFHAMFAGGRQPTLQEVHAWLSQKRFRGWGNFMAYEVVTDLRHTRYLEKATDKHTWAVAGPGAIRGLNRLHGRPYKKSMSQPQACVEMRELLEISRANLPDFIPDLEMRDIEHSLCETDKWLRVQNREGRLRNKYVAVDPLQPKPEPVEKQKRGRKPKPPSPLQAELPWKVAS